MTHLLRNTHGTRNRLQTGFAMAVLLFLSGVPTIDAASPSSRVFFKDGRSIEVSAVRMEEGKAILTMPGGDVVAFASGRIDRIEEQQVVIPEPASVVIPVTQTDTDESPAEQGKIDIDMIIAETAARYALDERLLKAVIAVESDFRVNAVSPMGAQGLMQLMPGTARELNVEDPFDPEQNIDGGARYLKQLIDANGGHYWRALAAYNAGSGRVARYDGLPPYRETISYIRKVLELYGSPEDSN